MNRKRSMCTDILLSLVLVLVPVQLSAQGESEMCTVEVKEPRAGQAVGLKGILMGTARLRPDHHLWVFVRPALNFEPLELWWPQGKGRIDPSTGGWKVPATYGSAGQNIGEEFDVTAAVFAPQEHAELVAYLERALQTGNWPPIRMPKTACAATTFTVIKRTD